MALFMKPLHCCEAKPQASKIIIIKKNNTKKPCTHSLRCFVSAELQLEIQAIRAFSRCGMKAPNIIGREPLGCSVWNVPWDSNWATVKPLMYIRVITVILLCVCARLFLTQRQSGASGSAGMTRGALETGRSCQTCTQPFQTASASVLWTSRWVSSPKSILFNSENFIYTCGAIKNQKPIEKSKKKIKNQTHTCDWAMLAASISFSEQNEHNEFIGWKRSQ